MKPHILRINGQVVSREEFLKNKIGGEGLPSMTQGYSQSKPGKSISLGVHPDQAGMMNEEIHKLGIRGVEYDTKGTCIITSRAGRRQLMREAPHLFGGMTNIKDADGGYGDG